MSSGQIKFQEPGYARPLAGPKRSWLTSLVIKVGLAKDERGAQKVLLIILALAIIGIVLIFVLGLGGGQTKPPVPSINGTPQQSP